MKAPSELAAGSATFAITAVIAPPVPDSERGADYQYFGLEERYQRSCSARAHVTLAEQAAGLSE